MIGTNEIRVRYEKVSELIKCLSKYKKALGKMKKSITAIREVYKEGKGKTMEYLVNESDILIKYINGLEQDVSDLSTILVKYVTETTAIIKPEQRDRVMKIDRNNILEKKNSIINTCSKIPKIHTDVTVPHFDDWILWGEDEEERELELARRARNDDKLNSIKYHIRSVEKEITSLIDKVNGVYNGVKNYEDKDRQFAWEAKKLVKDKPTPVEKHDDGNGKIGDQVIHFGEGLLDSIVDLVKGLTDSTVGIVKYDASFVTYLYGELSGNEIPKWADDYCYNTSVETNEKIKAVLKDPMIVVDGIKNGVKDTYEEKGVAYCGGYAVGFIGTTVAGTKGMDKLAKLGKGGKATRTLEELGHVDDAMATVGDDLAKLAEEVKTATKVADTAEDLTKVTGKVKKVTKADELSEASKALVEDGEAAGKGSVVEEVVSRSGTNTKLNEIRNSLPNKYQVVDSYGNKIGNIAYSTSDIEGYSIEELKSFSKYGSKGKNGIKNPMDGWVSSVDNPAYSKDVLKINSDNEIDIINGYLRNNDTEYKIIEQYNQILGGNYEAKGNITIVSEREICPSCDNVIKAFSKDYANIEITLIDGTGKTYIVKNGVVQ